MYVLICSNILTLLRLLLYGRYCSQVETSTKHLDKLSITKEDIRMKLEVRRTRTQKQKRRRCVILHRFFTDVQ